MIARYKSRPITPVDATVWNGENITEVQAICPQVQRAGNSTTLTFPGPTGPSELYVGEVIMRNVGGQDRFSKLREDVFVGLYEPQ
jgi:hypothetical protein